MPAAAHALRTGDAKEGLAAFRGEEAHQAGKFPASGEVHLDAAAAAVAFIFHAERGIFAKQNERGGEGAVPATRREDEGRACTIDSLANRSRLVSRRAKAFERN